MNESENFKEQTLDESTMTSFDHLIINANIATFSAHYGFNLYENSDTNNVPYGQLESAAIGLGHKSKSRRICHIITRTKSQTPMANG